MRRHLDRYCAVTLPCWRTDEQAVANDEEVIAAAEPSMAMCPDGGLLLR
jgi:hypothetical protein